LKNNLPKIVWFLWLQGLENAPRLVKECYASWLRHNPGWEIIFLDENNIADHITLPVRQVTKQAYSDILRINLLAKHGGVWADATCYCNKPLDEWLYDNLTTGFFAFDRPVPDRMLGSWFLAGDKYNYIITTLQLSVNKYWNDNPDLVFIEDTKWKFLSKIIDWVDKRIWFSKLATEKMKVYPYFWFHYLFEFNYNRDNNFKEMWDATPTVSADIPHTMFSTGMFKPLSAEVKAHIDQKIAPLYKMTWKHTGPDNLDGTALGYLYKSG